MYDYNNKSNEKPRLKSKKQIQRGVQFSSSLLHTFQCYNPYCMLLLSILLIFKNIYLFIYLFRLHRVLAVACRLLVGACGI